MHPFSKLIKFILETSSRDWLIKELQSLPGFLIKEFGMASKAFSSGSALKQEKTGIMEPQEGFSQIQGGELGMQQLEGIKSWGRSGNEQDFDNSL